MSADPTADGTSEQGLLAGRVARSTAITSIRTLAGYAVSGVAMLVLAHRLTPGAYGVYSVLVAASLFAYQLITAGFAYSFSRAKDDVAPGVIDAAFWSFEAVYAAAAIVMIGISFLLRSESAHIVLRGMAGFLVIAPLRFPMMIRCWRRLEMGRLALIDFAEASVLQVGSLGLVIAGLGPRAFGYAIVAAAATSSGISMVLMRWHPSRPRFAPLRPWLGEVRPLFATGALMLIRDNAGAPLLSVVFGTAVAGYYGWAAGVSSAVVGLAYVSSHSLYLGFARSQDHAKIAHALGRATRILFLLIGGVVAIVGGAARPMTLTVFTGRWLPAVLGLRLLVAALGLAIILSIFINLAIADGRASSANHSVSIQCALTIGLGLPAAHWWGMQGYAGALLLATSLVTVRAWHETSQVYALGAKLAEFAMSVVMSSVAGALVGTVLFSGGGPSWPHLGEAVVVSLAVFAGSTMLITRGAAWNVLRDAIDLLSA